MGLHTYVAYSETHLWTGVTTQLIEAAATIKDDGGIAYTVPVPKANDPIRQFRVGDSVQFRLEIRHTNHLTFEQLQNVPLAPHPDTSQNEEVSLLILLPNGKEHKYRLGIRNGPAGRYSFGDPAVSAVSSAAPSSPTTVPPAVDYNAASGKVDAIVKQVQDQQAPTLSLGVLRQFCALNSADNGFYYQRYCDELKKRETPRP